MKKLTKRTQGFVLLGVVVFVTFAVWDTIATYPVQLLVVFVHECGHALASVLTGGSVRELVINPDLSGHMAATGGNQFLVSSAGYLTSVAFGALLIMLSSRRRISRISVGGVGGVLLILAVVFARPVIGLAFFFGIVVGGLMIAIATKGPDLAVRGVLFYVAIVSSMHSLADIRSDVLRLDSGVRTDATILAAHSGIPALVWALLWAVISLVVMLFAIRHAIRRWT